MARSLYSTGLLFQGLMLGFLAALVLVIPERYFVQYSLYLLRNWKTLTVWRDFLFFESLTVSLTISFLEETIKFCILLYFYHQERGLPKNRFCLFGLFLALGFVSAENLWYILDYGFSIIYSRLLSSSALHLILGILMALKLFLGKRKSAYLIVWGWHSIYNMAIEREWRIVSIVLLPLLICYTGWQLWKSEFTYDRSGL